MKNSILGIIMAYDRDKELRDLTLDRCVGAIPFGGRYRIIDFMLSSMVNSNITNIGIVLRTKYHSLIEHIGTGKDWDLARKIGGINLFPPHSYSSNNQFSSSTERRGKIEGLIGIRDYIMESKCEYVVMTNSNIVTNIDFQEVVEHHKESGADITCVCSNIQKGINTDTFFNVGRHNVVEDVCVGTDITGKCKHYGLGIYVIKKSKLEELTTIWASHNLKYFEQEGLTYAMKNNLKINAFIHTAYAKTIDDIRRYYDASMDLLSKDVRDEIFIKNRPIYTKVQDEQPTYYGDNAVASQSLIADGCTLEGTVENSIIFRDVRIEKEAVVKDCIVLQGCTICSKANISNVIADKNVTIGDGKTMMGHSNYPIVIAKANRI